MFKTGISNSLFNEFVSSYTTLTKNPATELPFVYVDERDVRLVTDIVDVNNEKDHDVLVVSVAQDGWMEYFSLGDAE